MDSCAKIKSAAFSGVITSCGRARKKVPESDARGKISTQTFRRALTASVDSCAEIKSAPFSGVTSSGRVWNKVPESDAGSQTTSTGLRHPSFDHCRI